jgi:hypothetical protein
MEALFVIVLLIGIAVWLLQPKPKRPPDAQHRRRRRCTCRWRR